jgi:hypothetical protein
MRFWCQHPLALEAAHKHIIATDPYGQSPSSKRNLGLRSGRPCLHLQGKISTGKTGERIAWETA